jgi:glycosyltransferase involved in cell wall biosynthesis
MKVLLLAPDYEETNGWGRYAAGVRSSVRRALPEAEMLAPEPSSLRSREIGLKQPALALLDALRLRSEAASCDLVHAAAEPLAPLARLLRAMTGTPYAVSVAGTYGDLKSYPPALRPLYRSAFLGAERLSALSRRTAALLRAQFPDAPIEIVAGGVSIPAASGEPAFSRRIISVGALKPRKGFHTLLRALGRLKRDGFPVACDIVGAGGEGGYRAELERIASEEGLGELAIFHGRVPEERLDALYRSAAAFVLPSEPVGTAFEGLGLVYLEAMARGLPAVGCTLSGAEDAIRDGEDGFLVPPGDPARLADRLRALLADEKNWKEMSLAARAHVERFRWERFGEKMSELYRSCVTN